MKTRSSVRRRLWPALACLALAHPPSHLDAQSPSPEIVVSASGGYTFDRALWMLRQQVVVPLPGPLLIDTFLLARGLGSGWSAWVGATWYPRRSVGWGAELGWVAAHAQSACAIEGTPQPDSYEQNPVACARIPSLQKSTSAIPVLATVTLRAAPRRDYSPFVKAGVGFALLGHSFVAVSSLSSGPTCTNCARIILEGGEPVATWAATLAAGLSIGGVSGYRLRVEARDFVFGIPVVTGPADPLSEHPVPPTSTRALHRFTLAVGLDLVLSGGHRRRY